MAMFFANILDFLEWSKHIAMLTLAKEAGKYGWITCIVMVMNIVPLVAHRMHLESTTVDIMKMQE